jgi:hypothetical protein
MPELASISPCVAGYHVCRRGQLVRWLGPAIWTVEIRGEVIRGGGDKIVASQARLLRRLDAWNEKTARLFAADCAERVLPLFEQERPDDARPRETIATARAFARGEATGKQLSAAWDAAWAAVSAGAAAGGAAGGAAIVAARAAAGGAARNVVWDAALAVAQAAALAAERRWQTRRLFEYLDGQRG